MSGMKKNVFFKIMLKYVWLFVIQLIMSYILAKVVVLGNTLIGHIIDQMVSGQQPDYKSFVPLIGMYIVAAITAAYIKSVVSGKYSLYVQTYYRKLIAEKLYRLEYRYFDKNGSASVINKMNSDITEADSFLSENLPILCTDFVTLITYSIYVGKLSMKLLIIMFLCYPAVLFLSNKIAIKVRKLRWLHRQKADMITKIIQDCLSGILVLRSFGAEDYFQEKVNAAADSIVDYEEKRTKITNAVTLLRKILQWIPNIICALYAYFLVRNGNITIGDLMAFFAILGKFVEAFIELPFKIVDMRENMVSIRRIEDILSGNDEPSGNYEGHERKDDEPVLEFDNVSFAYDGGSNILNSVSFKAYRGMKLAFVGESGGGKSTIFHLICGFYQPVSGSYKLYGKDFGDWDINAARKLISLVSQNVFLFPGTIKENVAYGNQKSSDEEIIEACKKAEIHDFIIGLADGYDTIVGERGILLSGGERQRISIARAILKDAPILLLDEPTSSIDVKTEKLIANAIEEVSKNKTSITIAHRLSTVIDSDCIMMVKNGTIVQRGTHSQLIEQNGPYRTMYALCQDSNPLCQDSENVMEEEE